MTDSRILPGARARLANPDGTPTREFYDFFRQLQDASRVQQELSEIATALGSPDGTIANIPTEGYLPTSTQVLGGTGIDVTGALSEGSAIVSLEPLADDGSGSPVAITRDSYGRVQGTRPLEPGDIPNSLFIYLTDESGNYLTDENGNLLYAGQPLVIVNTLGDLPAPVSDVITLEDNVCYLFTGTVDLAGDRLVCGRNTVIRGTSSENCRIKSTGLTGTALITSAWSLPMQDISIEADIAVSLDATANASQAIDWRAVNFVNCNTVGTVKSYNNFIQNDSAYINSGEIVFDGTIGTIGFFQCIFNGVAAKNCIRLPSTLTVSRRFRILYSSVIVPSTGTGINVSVSATIPTESYILDTVNFSGAGTYLAGVSTTSNTALFQNCRGITNTAVNGQMYMQGNATATTITNTTNYFKAAGTTSASSDNAKFSHSNNRLTCDAVVERKYLLICSASLSSGNNNVLECGFYDSRISAVRTPSKTKSTANASGKVENITFQCVTYMKSADYIEIHVRNTSASNNITVEEMNVTITEIN